MKKKGTIGIVATLGIGLCAYALSQQPQAKEEKKNQIQYLQAEKKASSTASSKKEDSIEAVNAKGKRLRRSRLSSKLRMKALSLLMGIIFITIVVRSHLMPSLVRS